MASSGIRYIPELVPKLHRAARKIIAREGLSALKSIYIDTPEGKTAGYWRTPPVSKRMAAVIRKEAIREGTYGSFNYENLTGWERSWDIELELAKTKGQGRMRITPPRWTKRARTREERAQKIEKSLEGMDERIDKHLESRILNKPEETFERLYKKVLKGKNK
mmetsp:Transcript_5312/g.6952  ORF Transcript_5312/g.6952 Transcript_5312/m.6952 type:complete len:163 (+) Transcript_5312:208-696(+)|eukprot:CAMPEP_0198147716 /NCGR_PEP_ID=MMETSP1443-20131203/37423_1 /TAXON_ID=186043 /ORGANISM="Entomoneis sp., Strain CCMP2396" /LENGTH=162 /DNA_ID=CAMNT_0043812163 /DNA_START=205 /DNA_END=693 /DNA_ORIENTATION=-